MMATSAIASTPTSPRSSERAVEITSGTSTATAPTAQAMSAQLLVAAQPERGSGHDRAERNDGEPAVAEEVHLLGEMW